MLTVSLHGIKVSAPIGLYKEEHILGNSFEVDIDVFVPTDNNNELPFVDYTIISRIVTASFEQPARLLEDIAQNIYSELNQIFSFSEKIKICIRKLNPPMMGNINYAQVCLER